MSVHDASRRRMLRRQGPGDNSTTDSSGGDGTGAGDTGNNGNSGQSQSQSLQSDSQTSAPASDTGGSSSTAGGSSISTGGTDSQSTAATQLATSASSTDPGTATSSPGSASATGSSSIPQSVSSSILATTSNSPTVPITSPPTSVAPQSITTQASSVSGSSLITSSVRITTTAIIGGQLTTFQTTVPTIVSLPQTPAPAISSKSVAAAVVGSILGFALIVVLGWLTYRRRILRKREVMALEAQRSARGRSRMLDDEDMDHADVVPMSYTGTNSSFVSIDRVSGGYPYGQVGGHAPPSHEMPPPQEFHRMASHDFAGKDPASVRALKASRSGSASGSIFREDFDDPTAPGQHGGNILMAMPPGYRVGEPPSPGPSITDPLMGHGGRDQSVDKFSLTSSIGAAALPSDPFRRSLPPSRTDSPLHGRHSSSLASMALLQSPQTISPSSAISSPTAFKLFGRTPKSSATTPTPSRKSQDYGPGRGSSEAPGRVSLSSLARSLGAGSSADPQAAGSTATSEQNVKPPHQYHYKKVVRNPQRHASVESILIPAMDAVQGDGSLTRVDRGSKTDIKPYLSESEDENPPRGPQPLKPTRGTDGMG